MTDALLPSVVRVDQHRAVVQGVELPTPPPARIYISGHMYRIAAPQSILPPIINVVKFILNWTGIGGRIAKNILYGRMTGGTGSTSDPVWLTNAANQLMSSWGTSNINSKISQQWTLNSVTARDCGGTSASAASTVAAVPGTDAATTYPPNVSVAISWNIAEVYRGGKPRTYLPGITLSATFSPGDSKLNATYCTQLDTAATLLLSDMTAHPVTGSTISLGTVSYYSGHAVRPTPLFRTYVAARVHERVDSQRRRSGPESAFLVTP